MEQNKSPKYLPSSVEKKKVILFYFFLWLLWSMQVKEMSVYEFFHFRQAMWWRMSFVVLVMTTFVLMVIPVIKILAFLLVIGALSVNVYYVYKAMEGDYHQKIENAFLPVFVWIGSRMMWVFDIKIKVSSMDTESDE